MTVRFRKKTEERTNWVEKGLDICWAEKRTKVPLPPFPLYQDKSLQIANCVIPLVYINFSPTAYFSLLSEKHLSAWNYCRAGASVETQTVVNLLDVC